MSIWGKIIGTTAGFAVGGPLGAIIGAAAGHAYDTYSDTKTLAQGQSESGNEARSAGGAQEDATRKIAFTIGVIVLGAKIAKADGRVTRDEVKAFREVFQVPPSDTKHVARVFNQARKDSAGFEPYARQIGRLFADRQAVLEKLMVCLFHIAKADGAVEESEIVFLSKVAAEMGLDCAAFDRLRAAEMGSALEDPFAILGVAASDDQATVRRAYHKLVREHHPDRLVAQGMPDEFVQDANAVLARINAAHDEINRRKGWT